MLAPITPRPTKPTVTTSPSSGWDGGWYFTPVVPLRVYLDRGMIVKY